MRGDFSYTNFEREHFHVSFIVEAIITEILI
jgi:hypothetical protein